MIRENLVSVTGAIRSAAFLTGNRIKSSAAVAGDRVKTIADGAVGRFGMRMTVTGAATAVFLGATSGAAWGITALDQPADQTGPSIEAHSVLGLDGADAPEPASAEAEGDDQTEEKPEESKDSDEPKDSEESEESEDSEKSEPEEPKPVGGLDEAQMSNAVAIIEAGADRGFDRDGWVVALACAMQESKFRNYANVHVPESYDYEYQAEGSDHDSVGLFQQRPSSGWGSVGELMDPKTSAGKFYGTLKNISGWEDMPVSAAAQAVQISAFPDAYAQWEDLAWEIVEEYERVN